MLKTTSNWQTKLDAIVDRRLPDLIQLRRHLHQHPEPSGEERETSLLLYQMLDKEGIEVRFGPEGRGVLADIASPEATDKPVFAVRGDIDALFIHDQKHVPYRSCREGVMHACGHDAHATLCTATVMTLNELLNNGDLPVPIRMRGILQPAEETCEGAKEMMAVGALDDVAAIIAPHMDPNRKLGTIGIRSGPLTASCDDVTIRVVGQGGHAARPHETNDPIAAAAQLINAIYLFISRVTDSQDAVVVTFGKLAGGDNNNVIPEMVELFGTVRTLSDTVRDVTFAHIKRIALSVAQMSGTQITVDFCHSAPTVNNNPEIANLLRGCISDVLGPTGIFEIPRASMGSEDFSFYLKDVPGAMLRLGCTSDKVGGPPLHSPKFDLDEESLRIGVKVLTRAVIGWHMRE